MSNPVLLTLLVAFAVVGVLAARWAWRDRRVDFLHRLALGAASEAVAATVFDHVVPVLVADGYAMAAHGGHTTIMERRFFPVWTILAAIFLFPVGLLALLARDRETVVIVSRDGVLELHGRCGKLTADFVIAVADEAAADQAHV